MSVPVGAERWLAVAVALRVVRPPVGLPLVPVCALSAGSSTARSPVEVAASAGPAVVLAGVVSVASVLAEGLAVVRGLVVAGTSSRGAGGVCPAAVNSPVGAVSQAAG